MRPSIAQLQPLLLGAALTCATGLAQVPAPLPVWPPGYIPPPQLVQGVDYSKPNYANSPILRKFVDKLPGLPDAAALGFYAEKNALNGADGQFLPVAKAMNGDTPAGVPRDGAYYEIAIVDYTEQLHSDLPPTKLRGYVQIEPPGAAVPPAGSKHLPLNYAAGGAIMYNGLPVYAYDKPHYLGPIIVTPKGTPTRVKFYNLLPPGGAGDIFIPVDVTISGAGKGPDGSMYSKNRATLHLHGGDNPWISDGTAHQWITPAGEGGTLQKGASQRNVPDMPLPASGSATYYWPNGLSGRLMFYHEHAMGITRLNVYAGAAAGYLVVDNDERSINTAAGIIKEVPLVIQDKTFVNDGSVPSGFVGLATRATTISDPLWASGPNWGQSKGSLWWPHVYMPNQNPNDPSGSNPVGRWDYGPWFWPIFPSGIPPQNSAVPESFLDTPMVNGTAYPYIEVAPGRHRLRILNACNDRFVNLQIYVADPTTAAPDGRTKTEVRMVPAFTFSGLPPPFSSWNGKALNAYEDLYDPVTGLAKPVTPGTFPVPTVSFPPEWTQNDTPGTLPNIIDQRAGGIPDPSPSLQGPKFIHIGSEGGISGTVDVMTNIPIGYEQNKRSITVLNVMDHTLFLGPAERADVIVDFSKYAGKTLIVYNDAPAPVPASDPRLDYYTGNPDFSDSGGAPSTQVGYGPNTRTIMQIRVTLPGGTPGAVPLEDDAAALAALSTKVAQVFAATQPAAIVPANTFARIESTSMTFGGVTRPLLPKAIVEEFDPLGRMYSTLGVEQPFTTAMIQTTIPYGFADPVTEVIPSDGIQLWKITHNGVDTHAIHFHLFNVQLINRVGWDGAIKPPEPYEMGWKETVRMNPLEDCIVALRAKVPVVPFTQTHNVRFLAPELPPNATTIPGTTWPFFGQDPNGIPVQVFNKLANFGHEYTWHCHLLGHEENDMMRPIAVAFPPAAPTGLTASLVTGSSPNINLTWTNSDPAQTRLVLQRALNATFTSGLRNVTIVNPTTTTYRDNTTAKGVTYYYRIGAISVVGSGVAGYPSLTTPPGYSASTSITTPP